MNKENKGLIIEIILIGIIMLIAIPICASASTNYSENIKEKQKNNIAINITNNNPNKIITLNNHNEEKTRIKLVLRISKFSNEYLVKLDDSTYSLNSIEYKEDGDYYYYNLGNYELNEEREFNFQLINIGVNDYDETLKYSFIAEV